MTAIAVNVQSAAYQIAKYRSTLQPDRNPLSFRKSLASRASKRKALGSGAEDDGVAESESKDCLKNCRLKYELDTRKRLQANVTTLAEEFCEATLLRERICGKGKLRRINRKFGKAHLEA